MTDKEKIETLEKRVCDMETFWKEQVSCRVTINAQQYFDRGMWWALKICTVREGPYPQWIKVTPETMPPDDDTVIVTVEHPSGDRYIYTEARFDKDRGKWEWPYEAGADYWEDIEEKVTHWMPFPKPAED